MKLPHIHLPVKIPIFASIFALGITLISATFFIYQQSQDYQVFIHQLQQDIQNLNRQYLELQSQDQLKINEDLKKQISATQEAYKKTITVYEKLVDAKVSKLSIDGNLAAILRDLHDLNYASAEAKLAKLDKDIDTAVAAAQIVKGIDLASLTVSQSPPGSGYQRQKVLVNGQEFVVDIVAADLNSTRVLVDTASDHDCGNDCPVLPLATYAARNGAFAAINGSYFCPASYPSCAGKTNTFDLLLMNKNKVYFNSDNNVYSSNPAVIFQGSSVRFVGKAMEWGRDTGIDSMISNYPLLVMSGQSQFGGDGDPKKSGIGTRSFIASKGSTVYIGVVRGVLVAQAAQVLQAIGMDHAMNLDSGGSTALWVNGSYKAGPGRDIPNAIVLVKR